MAAEEGHLTLTAQQLAAGAVVVTPSSPPSGGKADLRRTYEGTQRVRLKPLAVRVDGATLVIDATRCRVDDQIFWTSYPQ